MINMTQGIWYIETRIDTRSIDLETRKPISGTGEVYSCDCCEKDIEVWVYVRSKDGQCGTVGTTCAKKAVHIHGKELLGANYTLTRHNLYRFADVQKQYTEYRSY